MPFRLEAINYTQYPLPLKDFKKTLKRVFLVLKKPRPTKNYSLELIYLDEHRSKELNRLRHKKTPANVLAFPEPKAFAWIFSKKTYYLGQVFLTPSVIHKQAKKLKISYNFWLKTLFIHGVLHLFGYGHKTRSQKKLMESLENKIFNI